MICGAWRKPPSWRWHRSFEFPQQLSCAAQGQECLCSRWRLDTNVESAARKCLTCTFDLIILCRRQSFKLFIAVGSNVWGVGRGLGGGRWGGGGRRERERERERESHTDRMNHRKRDINVRGRYPGGRRLFKWRQSSQSNYHFTIGTRQTQYHEALPSSANDEVRCDCTFTDDSNASWYWVCRVPMEWRLDCENCRRLTVVSLHDTGPRFSRACALPLSRLEAGV